MFRGGACVALAGSCLLHSRAESGEGGGEVFEGPSEGNARVADGVGDEIRPSPVFSEGRDKGGTSLSFLRS